MADILATGCKRAKFRTQYAVSALPEPIFNLSRCGARASASPRPAVPDGQTGTNFRTGTDRLAPYHRRCSLEPANSRYVIAPTTIAPANRFIGMPTTGIELARPSTDASRRCLGRLSTQEFPSSIGHTESSKLARAPLASFHPQTSFSLEIS